MFRTSYVELVVRLVAALTMQHGGGKRRRVGVTGVRLEAVRGDQVTMVLGGAGASTGATENQPKRVATLAGRDAQQRQRQTTSGQRRADAEQLPLPPVRRVGVSGRRFRSRCFRFRSEDVGQDEDLKRQNLDFCELRLMPTLLRGTPLPILLFNLRGRQNN